jgi:thymidylate kinase
MVKIITFEGADYVGKTTASKYLAERFAGKNSRLNTGVVYPTDASLKICNCANGADDITKELLYTTAFILDKPISEHDDTQEIIIQDRYWPSTVAYGRFLNMENSLHNKFDLRGLFIEPVAVVYLVCSPEEKIKRSTLRKRKSFLDEHFIRDRDLSSKLEAEIIRVISGLPNVISIDTTRQTVEETVLTIEKYLGERGILP